MKNPNWKTCLLAICFYILLSEALVSGATPQDYALRTGANAFFRTEAITDNLLPSTSFTIEFWFRAVGPGVLVNEVDSFVISAWDYSFAEVSSADEIVIGLPGLFGTRSLGKISLNEWQHVALRYDDVNSTYTGFLNGAKIASLTGKRKSPSDASREAYLAFGRLAQNNLTGAGWFSGNFDEIRIWRTARSDSEISTSWQNTIPANAPNLAVNWHLNEGSGDPRDASGQGRNGINVGAQWVVSDLNRFSGPPIVENINATIGSDQSVTLGGSVNPNNIETTLYFEHGLTTAYGNKTPVQVLPQGTDLVSVAATLRNLAPGLYHFRLTAINPNGTVSSEDATFTLTKLSGNAVAFDGADDYLLASTIGTRQFFSTKSMTIQLWFEASGLGVIANEVDAFDVSLWDYSLLEVLSDGSLVATLPNVPTIKIDTITFGRWYNIALRYDENTSVLDCFLNGTKRASTLGVRKAPWEVGRPAYLAFGRGGPQNLGPGHFLPGAIDELAIWRTAISELQIQQNVGLVLKGSDSDLYGLWHFDSVTGDNSPDSSPQNHAALFVNGPVLTPSPLDLLLDQRPEVQTGAFHDVNPFSGTLSGSINKENIETMVYFLYGPTSLANISQTITIPPTTATTNVEVSVSGLTSGTEYHYMLLASNRFGITAGGEKTFVKVGWAGYALSTGGNTSFRTVSDQQPFFVDETVTVELWVRPEKAGVIFGESDRANSNLLDNSLMEILPSGTVIAGFPGLPIITLGKIEIGTWNHLALRYNRQSQTMDGFLNGIKTSATSGDRVAPWELGRQGVFTFGKATQASIGTGAALSGEFDEIRIWNRARTDAEIGSSFMLKLLGNEQGLVLYWRFDERNSVITDYSRHNNAGQVQGPANFVVSAAPVTVDYRPIQMVGNGLVTVEFLATPGQEVEIQKTSDFKTWDAISNTVVDSLGIARANVKMDDNYAFYRIRQL